MKKELLDIIKSKIIELKIFNYVDLYEQISYAPSDYPVCVIKDSSDAISEISSGCWKVESSIDINIFNNEGLQAIALTNKVLEIFKNIPNDTFVFEVEGIDKESEYYDGLMLRTSLHLKVSYFTQRFQL